MKSFVRSPNLPERCAMLIYGERYAGFLEKSLDSLKIESILMPDNPHVDSRLAGHADLSILHAGGNQLFLAPFLKGSVFAAHLQELGAEIRYPDVVHGASYPHDVQFNLCMIKDRIILNPKTAAESIVDYLTNISENCFVPVRQGYSRCAACVVDGSSIITADRGLAAASDAAGLHVLLIHPGHIQLNGYDYGFIGGASFKIASDRLAFTGHLSNHPDKGRILRFLDDRGIEPVFLSKYPAFDIGTAIPILEN